MDDGLKAQLALLFPRRNSVHTPYLQGKNTIPRNFAKKQTLFYVSGVLSLKFFYKKTYGSMVQYQTLKTPRLSQYIRVHYTETHLKLATWSDYKDMQLYYKLYTCVNFNRQHITLARAAF